MPLKKSEMFSPLLQVPSPSKTKKKGKKSSFKLQRSTEKKLHIPSEASLNFCEDLMKCSALSHMINMKTELF